MAARNHPVRLPVIATLADVYCYQTSEQDGARLTAAGAVQPPTTHRRSFPKVLKRLRDRLRILDERLTLDTNGLRQEVLNLELAKSLLEKKLHDRDTRQRAQAVAVVTEYFNVFQYGWRELNATDNGCHEDGRAADHAHAMDRQHQFLRTAVDPTAVDELRCQWQHVASWCSSCRLVVERVECVGEPSEPIVLASGVLHAVPTGVLPPPSRASAGDTRWSAELGAWGRVTFPVRVVCCFNAAGRMVAHDMEIDRVVALQNVLREPARVDRVLQPEPVRRDDARDFRL